MSIQIRYGKEEDIPILVGFQLKMAEETESLRLDEETVAHGVSQLIHDRNKGFYLIATENEQDIAGCLIITYEWSDWRNGWIWWIGSLYVEKIYRQQGIFRKLLEKVVALSRTENVKALRLYMDENNETARSAYLRSGFKFSNYQVFEYEDLIIGSLQ